MQYKWNMERERLVLLMLSAINGLRRLSDGFIFIVYAFYIILIYFCFFLFKWLYFGLVFILLIVCYCDLFLLFSY